MSELPRLLLCTFEVIPSPTGASRRITEYLRALAGRFEISILSPKTTDLSHIAKYETARLLRVPVGEGDLHSQIDIYDRAARRQLASEEYAVVHFFDPFSGYTVCEQRAGYAYKIVYEANRFPSQELRFTRPSLAQERKLLSKLRRQELFCLMNADRVLTGSELTRKFIQSLGVAEDQVEVLRAPAEVTRPVVEAPPERFELLYLGSRSGWNDLPTLLEAVKLASSSVKLRLRIAASNPLEPLPPLPSSPPLIEVLGPVDSEQLPALLDSVHAGVVPLADVDRNRVQGTPLAKVSDLLGAGKPVIAADLPAARELLPDSGALYYQPGNAQSLASCLVELARVPDRRRELGASARAYAERHLDARRIRAQLLSVYAQLLGREWTPLPAGEAAVVTSTGTPTSRALAAEPDTQKRARPRKKGSTQPPLPPASAAAPDGRPEPTPLTDRTSAPPPPLLQVVGSPAPGASMAPQPPRLPAHPKARSAKTPMPRRTPGPPRGPRGEPLGLDDIQEISADEIEEADEAPAETLPPSKLDPWFAQLVYGYCPPAVTFFARHTPPTNFPGKS